MQLRVKQGIYFKKSFFLFFFTFLIIVYLTSDSCIPFANAKEPKKHKQNKTTSIKKRPSVVVPPKTPSPPPPAPATPTPLLKPTNLAPTQKTVTLLTLTGSDGFVLKGASAIKLFYLPILQAWHLNDVSLHFIVYRAALSNKVATLTLLINDNPISSIELNQATNSKIPWDIVLPGNLLKGNVINLKITSTTNDNGHDCYNLANPNYWVYFTGDSSITYHYIPQQYGPDLSKYPYPFLKDPSLEKDAISIVLPDEFNLDTLTSAFYISNSLGRHATWRGIQLNTRLLSDLSNTEKIANNIIYIGTANSLMLDKNPLPWPLPIVNGKLFDKDNHEIPADTGVIMLITSPFNAQNALLAITGNSDVGVKKAAAALRDPNFSHSVLFASYAYVMSSPELKEVKINWTNTTLKELGYDTQTLYGVGENTINYPIYLPDTKTLSKLVLTVDYAISPFLATKESSFLTLKVNDAPTAGTILNPFNPELSHWKVILNGNSFNPGLNMLSFVFNLKLKNVKCTPDDAALGWATLYGSTSLRAMFNQEKPLLSLIKFPSTLNGDLLIILGNANPYFHSNLFLQSILELSEKLNKINHVQFISQSALTPELAQKNNILFIGNIEKNTLFDHYKKMLPFYFDDGKLIIASNILPYLAISDETPLGMIQLLASPFNPAQSILMLSGENMDGYPLGFDTLTQDKKLSLINGNTALIYKNGTFTSIQSQKLEIYANNKKTINTIANRTMLGVFLAFLFFILLIIIKYIRQKIKNYFSKQV